MSVDTTLLTPLVRERSRRALRLPDRAATAHYGVSPARAYRPDRYRRRHRTLHHQPHGQEIRARAASFVEPHIHSPWICSSGVPTRSMQNAQVPLQGKENVPVFHYSAHKDGYISVLPSVSAMDVWRFRSSQSGKQPRIFLWQAHGYRNPIKVRSFSTKFRFPTRFPRSLVMLAQ